MTDPAIIMPSPSFIEVDGLRIRIMQSSAGPGLPIVLTAPWPESIYAFNSVWERMQAIGPVTAVDLPGFGQSETRSDLMSPDAMGDFLIEVLDHLRMERAHFVAPDIGTLATLYAASRKPERFESIVGGSGGISLNLLGDPLKRIVGSTRDDFAALEGGEQVYQLVKTMARATIPEGILEDYRTSSQGQRWNEVADFVRAYQRDLPRLETLLPAITVPTLVISGKHDPFVPPANGSFLAERMPHCRADIVDAGHFVWEEASDIYASLIADWITGEYRDV